MSLASPERLIWLTVALPIIGFYILKTRLRRRQVATLLFWDQLFEEKRQRSLWQNLRHWLSLLLQLVLVGLLGFALADPLWRTQSDRGQELILVVDNSASMQASEADSGQTRLELAIAEAKQVAQGLRQGDRIALMTAGNSVRVRVGMTDFAPTIDEALDKIEPTDGPTRVDQAIRAARRLANDPQRRRIVVFTDGCLPDSATQANAEIEDGQEEDRDDQDVRFVQVGSRQDNVAMTRFQVRRSTTDPIGYALLAEIQNFGDAAIETRLKLQLNDDLVDVIPISLAGGETFRRTIEGTSQPGGILLGSIDVADGLLADNKARAVLPERASVPVTLVSSGESDSFYLRNVLKSIPRVNLTDAPPDFDASKTSPGSLTVFSGVMPTVMPPGPTLIVGPPRSYDPNDLLGVGPLLDSPIVAKQDKSSPILRHVQLQNVILDGGSDVTIDQDLGEATALLETAGGAKVLVAVERETGRVLVLSANLATSDLPLRIAFPVMMTNAMNWFFRESGELNPAIATGQVTTVPWDVAGDAEPVGQVTLVKPGGARQVVTVNQKRVTIGPIEKTGVYGVFQTESLAKFVDTPSDVPAPSARQVFDQGARGHLVAVNLCDARESDLRAGQDLGSSEDTLPPSGSSAWFLLAMLALGLVVTEWALFNRRIVA